MVVVRRGNAAPHHNHFFPARLGAAWAPPPRIFFFRWLWRRSRHNQRKIKGFWWDYIPPNHPKDADRVTRVNLEASTTYAKAIPAHGDRCATFLHWWVVFRPAE